MVRQRLRGRESTVTGQILTILMALLIFGGQACGAGTMSTDFPERVSKLGELNTHAWMRVRGEAMLHTDRVAFEQHAKFPRCVSGVFANQRGLDLTRYDGREVVVAGQLVDYASLPNDGSALLPRKILNGSIIPNFCFGANVLLVRSIHLK